MRGGNRVWGGAAVRQEGVGGENGGDGAEEGAVRKINLRRRKINLWGEGFIKM